MSNVMKDYVIVRQPYEKGIPVCMMPQSTYCKLCLCLITFLCFSGCSFQNTNKMLQLKKMNFNSIFNETAEAHRIVFCFAATYSTGLITQRRHEQSLQNANLSLTLSLLSAFYPKHTKTTFIIATISKSILKVTM